MWLQRTYHLIVYQRRVIHGIQNVMLNTYKHDLLRKFSTCAIYSQRQNGSSVKLKTKKSQEKENQEKSTTPLVVELLMGRNQQVVDGRMPTLISPLAVGQQSYHEAVDNVSNDENKSDPMIERKVSSYFQSEFLKNIDSAYEYSLVEDSRILNEAVDQSVFDKSSNNSPDTSENLSGFVSDTPCPGCGATLHSQQANTPGYVSCDKFLATPKEELRNLYCHRCHMMRDFNIALNVSVSSEEYRKIIAKVKDVHALTVLIVDMLDIPNSLFKDLPDLIGKKRPLFILGNKVDMLPKDGVKYLRHLKNVLNEECRKQGYFDDFYVHYVGLISAKTGYGVEQLITRIFNFWSTRDKGHVYILGCTNAGKSSLFNTLIKSDFCKTGARDFMMRATIAAWPGTTLNLLKFPITTPVCSQMEKRTKRLKSEKKEAIRQAKLAKQTNQMDEVNSTKLKGQVHETFMSRKESKLEIHHTQVHGYDGATYSFNSSMDTVEESQRTSGALWRDVMGQEECFDDELYEGSCWCFDTPGVVNLDQVINILNEEELKLVISKNVLKPRIFLMHPSDVMFVSGLGRLDYVEGPQSAYFSVLTSPSLPVHIMSKSSADPELFYKQNLGTAVLGIPIGDKSRLDEIPPLEGIDLDIEGSGWDVSDTDITLSSLGWVAVTGGRGMAMKIRAYTPGGAGCGIRKPGLMPDAVKRRGMRVPGTPLYKLKSAR